MTFSLPSPLSLLKLPIYCDKSITLFRVPFKVFKISLQQLKLLNIFTLLTSSKLISILDTTGFSRYLITNETHIQINITYNPTVITNHTTRLGKLEAAAMLPTPCEDVEAAKVDKTSLKDEGSLSLWSVVASCWCEMVCCPGKRMLLLREVLPLLTGKSMAPGIRL